LANSEAYCSKKAGSKQEQKKERYAGCVRNEPHVRYNTKEKKAREKTKETDPQ
jgi:hypothetical protein